MSDGNVDIFNNFVSITTRIYRQQNRLEQKVGPQTVFVECSVMGGGILPKVVGES